MVAWARGKLWVGHVKKMSSSNYKFLAPPPNANKLSPRDAREVFRINGYYGPTSGFCSGYIQANVAVLPSKLAVEFQEFCRRNFGPLPVLYCSQPGEVGAPPLAGSSDIRYVPMTPY